MSHPPNHSFGLYGQEDETPSTRPYYPALYIPQQPYQLPTTQLPYNGLLTTQNSFEIPTTTPMYPPSLTPQHSFQMPFQQQPSPHSFEQPSPVYTSPAYTPAPYIMDMLSPAPVVSQQAPSTLAFQNNTPRGRAVIIGINYFNQKGEMRGRVDEARNLSRYLQQAKRYRKEDIILLSDDQRGDFSQPTKKNILAALIWLGKNAQQGEKLILYYSGHGRVSLKAKKTRKGKQPVGRNVPPPSANGEIVVVKDRNKQGSKDSPEEELETIYPVDFREFKEGWISPKDLNEMLKPAREKGAKLTLILDAHAGVR